MTEAAPGGAGSPLASQDGASAGTRLAGEARAGSRLALSRLLTAIESRTLAAEARAAGLDDFVFVKSNNYETNKNYLAMLGVL